MLPLAAIWPVPTTLLRRERGDLRCAGQRNTTCLARGNYSALTLTSSAPRETTGYIDNNIRSAPELLRRNHPANALIAYSTQVHSPADLPRSAKPITKKSK